MSLKTLISKARRTVIIVFSVGFLSFDFVQLGISQEPNRIVQIFEVPYTHNRISVNGIADEWKEYRSNIDIIPKIVDADFRATVKTAWDEEKLYVFFRVKDRTLFANETSDEGVPWRDDAVEIYLSVAPDDVKEDLLSPREYQFIVNLNGTLGSCRGTSRGTRDHSWNADILSAVRWKGTLNSIEAPDDEEYSVEIAIPWKVIGLEARSGVKLLVDFAVINRMSAEASTSQLIAYDWASLERFGNPKKWNQIILQRAPVHSDPDTVQTGQIPTLFKIMASIFLLIVGMYGGWVFTQRKNRRQQNGNENTDLTSDESISERESRDDPATQDGVSDGLKTLAGRVLQILMQEYSSELSAGSIAKRLNVSERHMRRALKRVKGQTFSKILQEIRLHKAKVLLEENELSIAEVALTVGFGEQSYFSKLFKARYSESPSNFRTKFLSNE